jgi:hypothetical protein
LACSVRTEVEEDRGVIGGQPRPALDRDGLDELVRDAGVVAGLNGLDRGLTPDRFSVDDGVVREFRAVPALVAVHRVVAAGDGGDLVGRQLGQVVDRRVRGDVPSIGEGMDERALLRPLAVRQLEQRAQVVDVRVNAAVGDEAEQVDVRPPLLGALESADERRVLEERAVGDRPVHTLEVLVEDAPGADRQVPHLGIAHLAFREPDRLA